MGAGVPAISAENDIWLPGMDSYPDLGRMAPFEYSPSCPAILGEHIPFLTMTSVARKLNAEKGTIQRRNQCERFSEADTEGVTCRVERLPKRHQHVSNPTYASLVHLVFHS
jgi:hypothetical protein